MTGEIIYATIFMVCFVILGGVVMYLSKTIDAGEARFDSETGKQMPSEADAETEDSKAERDRRQGATDA